MIIYGLFIFLNLFLFGFFAKGFGYIFAILQICKV